MDSTEPPRIVLQAQDACVDVDGARGALNDGVGPARAPSAGWILTVRLTRGDGRRLQGVGDLQDASGATIAHRELGQPDSRAGCPGLTRAMGVWAGLVLETEVEKASALTSEPVPSIAAEAGPVEATSGWPPPAKPEPASPEHDWYLHHDEGRSLELGAGAFLMSGSGGGALAGPLVFAVVETGHGIFLRPSIAFGETLTSLPPSDVHSAMWGAGRLDACLRLPGLYTKNHGMQLDVCGGADGGVTHIESITPSDLPYFAVGPSVGLRGELGSRLAATLRAVAGIAVVRGTYTDLEGNTQLPPLATARVELAFSWDMR